MRLTSKYNSRYRDLNTCDPLYSFGYGLSYTTFAFSNLQLSSASMSPKGHVTATVKVTNTGSRTGDEVAQLYIHDPVASISQPVRRLRGFERFTLAPGQTRTVSFTLDRRDVGFYDNSGRFVVEPGQIEVYAGDSSKASLTTSFTVPSARRVSAGSSTGIRTEVGAHEENRPALAGDSGCGRAAGSRPCRGVRRVWSGWSGIELLARSGRLGRRFHGLSRRAAGRTCWPSPGTPGSSTAPTSIRRPTCRWTT